MRSRVTVLLLLVSIACGCADESNGSGGSVDLCAKLRSVCTGDDESLVQSCEDKVAQCENEGLVEQKWDLDKLNACNDSLDQCMDLIDCYADARYCAGLDCDDVTLVSEDCPSGTELADVTSDDFVVSDYVPCNSWFFSYVDAAGTHVSACYLDHCMTEEELLGMLCK
jgi:hypothetical protein